MKERAITYFYHSMRRFFVKNIIFIVAINVLVKPVWVFFIDRVVQNRVPGGDYGTYQALLSLGIIFQIVLDFGITSYNSRTIARDPELLGDIFPAMLSARLVLMALYMVLGYSWGIILGYKGWELQLLTGILLIQALNTLLAFIRSNIAALHRFKTDGILSITDRLMMIFVCGFLLIYPATAHRFRIEWFVIAQAACYLVTALIAYFVLRRISGIRLRFAFHLPTVTGIIKQSLPYALLIFQMSIYNRADAMMIERLCADGKAQADIWASAFRMLDMVNILGLMFATMLLPMYGRMLGNKHDIQPIVKLCANMLLPFSFVVAAACIFFSGDIMHILYKGATEQNIHAYKGVFSWLMASFPAWCLMYIYSTLLTANGNMKVLNCIALAGVLLNLSLNFYMIPRFSAVGGAITSFITQTSLALAFVIACARIFRLHVNVKWILAHIGYMILTLALAWASAILLTGLNWIVRGGIFFMICVLLMFLFRFISPSSIKLLINKKRAGV